MIKLPPGNIPENSGFHVRIKNEILPLLGGAMQKAVSALPLSVLEQVEEIRLRQERPLIVRTSGGELTVTSEGVVSYSPQEGYMVSATDLERTVQLVTQSSLYAVVDELRQGYLTVRGGHRIGFAGEAVLEKGKVKTLKNFAGLNIRFAREMKGCADGVLPYLLRPQGDRPYHTMIVSPPRAGKTTLLRDIVRQLSNGIPSMNFPGTNVGVVDERSEIAGCFRGVPQNDVGIRTDVLDGCPKAEGMLMLLRSMGPQVIATDEIGGVEDVAALEEMLNAGVALLVTVHGSHLGEVENRPTLKTLVSRGVFERVVVLGRSLGVGTVEAVLDGCTRRNILPLAINGSGPRRGAR
ncbi:stage III sporulation protein AA [Clostridiales bacterium PH28_bin88]|nr:stage III sporulation protein AA [Clostridiales bacterium PH28_bin88]